MPRGDKSKYTKKQKRQAEHIEEGYEDRGLSKRESKRRAWATVNKVTGGGKKPRRLRARPPRRSLAHEKGRANRRTCVGCPARLRAASLGPQGRPHQESPRGTLATRGAKKVRSS